MIVDVLNMDFTWFMFSNLDPAYKHCKY